MSIEDEIPQMLDNNQTATNKSTYKKISIN